MNINLPNLIGLILILGSVLLGQWLILKRSKEVDPVTASFCRFAAIIVFLFMFCVPTIVAKAILH